MEYLTTSDINTIGLWLSPDFVVPLARHHGGGDPVVGAKEAYSEVRGLIRSYATYVRWREGRRGQRDIGLAQAIRALGYMGIWHKVAPLKDPSLFRQTAFSIWPMGVGAEIPGEVVVNVGDIDQKKKKAAAIRAISTMLKEIPELNVAILDNRVWQRKSPEVMLNVSIRGEIRSIIFSAAGRALSEINTHLTRTLRKLIEIEGHPLRFMSNQLLALWSDHFWETKGTGFLASPAGAAVSFMPSKPGLPAKGYAALVPFNGIPLCVNVGLMDKGDIAFCLTADHRAIDGDTMEKAYDFLYRRMTFGARG